MVDKFSAVQLDFLENLLNIPAMDERVSQEGVLIGPSRVPLEIVRNKRAKRYIIRLLPELVLRVTIPREVPNAKPCVSYLRILGGLKNNSNLIAFKKPWIPAIQHY